MNNAALSYGYQNLSKRYQVNEILEASPEKLLLKVYDFAIVNSKNENLAKTNKALQVLIDALRFDTDELREVSTGLLRLYKFCQDQMREGNYEIVSKVLQDLKSSWLEAFSQKQ
ncbi:MAG: flagellar protein FliS [Melioribacteraceae bacterium]|nr:flagellar protein FliS [Melioribacteraceae bacterium]MCF8353753.1 flagellar protein FliS [Melioribacteraceae bacterium]MCF8392438.1 flagellar protein FliS [Melioribacteraceae bacterium]MCF8418349.1 flagellar protein FliS [Melioribacteraceae bacterium]